MARIARFSCRPSGAHARCRHAGRARPRVRRSTEPRDRVSRRLTASEPRLETGQAASFAKERTPLPTTAGTIIQDTTRREFLGRTLTTAAAAAVSPTLALTQPTHGAPPTASPVALELARFLSATRFGDLPRVAVEHAKIAVASTLASAAAGSRIESAAHHPRARQGTGRALGRHALVRRRAAADRPSRARQRSSERRIRLRRQRPAQRGALGHDARGRGARNRRTRAHVGARSPGGDRHGLRGGGAHQRSLDGAARFSRLAGRRIRRHRGRRAATWAHGRADGPRPSLTATTVGGLAIGTNSWAREYHAGNAALTAVNAALAAGRGFTANPDMLEAERGFVATFAGNGVDPSSLVRDLGGEWDIVTHLAIKLVPGAHAFHPAVEAAVNAARQASVAPERIARILVVGSAPIVRCPSRSLPPDLVEAIHSLPYFLASAVADRDFSWIHATPEKIASAPMARAHRARRRRPVSARGRLRVELGCHGDDRHDVGRALHQHGRRAARVRPARHRVARRRRQVLRVAARLGARREPSTRRARASFMGSRKHAT